MKRRRSASKGKGQGTQQAHEGGSKKRSKTAEDEEDSSQEKEIEDGKALEADSDGEEIKEGEHDHPRLRVGHAAPAFSADGVAESAFMSAALSDFQGQYVLLLFYPLDFTFVCPTELLIFNERLSDFRALNVAVLGISVDSKYTHLTWVNTSREKGGLDGVTPFTMPLLSDLSHSISRDYGVLNEEEGYSNRCLVIISDRGIVRSIINNDDPVGRNVEEVLRLLKALIHTDSHPGEVCPVNWDTGAETIKANPEDCKQYFSGLEMDVEH